MKIAVFEYVHFQYAFTITELFQGCDFIYIYSSKIQKAMQEFNPDFKAQEEWIYEKEDLATDYAQIIARLDGAKIDLICINPIFDNFKAFSIIAKQTTAKKLLTTHNINNWFRQKFRSPKGWKERKQKLKIIQHADYIAVEDFIYRYLKEDEPELFNKYPFIYIPYTFFMGNKQRKYYPSKEQIKVVLPGSIDKERRRYEAVLEAIPKLLEKDPRFVFSFAGPILGDYGKSVQRKLEIIKKDFPSAVIFFKEKPKPEEFKCEMETADLVLSTSTFFFYGLGRTAEAIGKTKPTAAIHDMMTYQLPGLLPEHLKVPQKLNSSILSYADANDLFEKLLLFSDNDFMQQYKENAKQNMLEFTAEKIREQNSFLFN